MICAFYEPGSLVACGARVDGFNTIEVTDAETGDHLGTIAVNACAKHSVKAAGPQVPDCPPGINFIASCESFDSWWNKNERPLVTRNLRERLAV